MEVAVLRRLQGVKQACKFLGCGRTDKANFMVMTLLGTNLSELRKRQPQQKFTIGTTLRLGVQIVSAVQAIHQCGFIHRDLKPSNFAMGRQQEDSKTCYILDFGLARQYTTPTGELRQPRPVAGFRGTVRYASVNAHFGHELGRHDDLWSVFYLMVELITGTLPWKKIRNKEEAGEYKQGYDHKKLIAGFPAEFKSYLDHIKNLTYYDKPNYSYLISLFEQALKRLKVNRTDPFEWEREQSTPSGTSVSGLTVPFGSVDNPDPIAHQNGNVNLYEAQYGRLSITENEQAKTDVPQANKVSESASVCQESNCSGHAKKEMCHQSQQHSSDHHERRPVVNTSDRNIHGKGEAFDVNNQLNTQQKEIKASMLRLPIDPQDYANKPQRAFQGLDNMLNDTAKIIRHGEAEHDAVHHVIEQTQHLYVNVSTSSRSDSNNVQRGSSSSEHKIGGGLTNLRLDAPTDPTKDVPFFFPQPPRLPPPPGYFCSSGRRRKFIKASGGVGVSRNRQQ